MGNYATQAQLETRFADDAELEALTDKAEGSGVDTDVLDDVIEAAEGYIDSAIATHYATPVDVSQDTTLAALLKRMTLDLAETYLTRRGEELSEVKREQRDKVFEWCEQIAKGERRLTGAATPTSTTSDGPVAAWSDSGRTIISSANRIFTRDTAKRL